MNIAKDVNVESLPPKMFLNNISVEQSDLPDTFADFFERKVNKIVESINVDETVYNLILNFCAVLRDVLVLTLYYMMPLLYMFKCIERSKNCVTLTL